MKELVNLKNTLVENDKLIPKDKKVSDHFSQFFKNDVKNFDIKGYNTSASSKNNPTNIAIEKFREKPSVRSIKKKKVISGIFCFQQTETNVIEKEINRLNNNKLLGFSMTVLLRFKKKSFKFVPQSSVKFGIMKLLFQDISKKFLNSLM